MDNFHYLDISFETATVSSHTLMYDFLTDHMSRLRDHLIDLEIDAIYRDFQPFAEEYLSDKSLLSMTEGQSHSLTMEMTELFLDLGTVKIPKWDLDLQPFFPKGSTTYNAVFPNGHKPFYKGDRNKRVQAFRTFRDVIISLPGIDPIKDSVDTYYQSFIAKYNALADKQKKLEDLSAKLEAQRIVVAREMYGNLGLLMRKFRNDPSQINLFFNFDMLRKIEPKPQEKVLTGSVAALQTVNLAEKEFTDTSEIQIENTGSTDLSFALVLTDTTICVDTGIIVHPDEKKKVMASELGNLNGHFLNCTNLYGFGEGFYTVTIWL